MVLHISLCIIFFALDEYLIMVVYPSGWTGNKVGVFSKSKISTDLAVKLLDITQTYVL